MRIQRCTPSRMQKSSESDGENSPSLAPTPDTPRFHSRIFSAVIYMEVLSIMIARDVLIKNFRLASLVFVGNRSTASSLGQCCHVNDVRNQHINFFTNAVIEKYTTGLLMQLGFSSHDKPIASRCFLPGTACWESMG